MSFGFGFGFPRRVGAALRAALDFNFLSGLLDPRITFTRASTGTYVNSSGVLSSAAIDTPRFDYDPVTLAAKGLLIEEQRTNLIRYSQDISTATWPAGTFVTTNVNSGVSPDGTQNATAAMETTNNGAHTVAQGVIVAANTSHAASIYLKANGRDQAIVYFGMNGAPYTRIGVLVDLSTGSLVNSDIGTPSSVTVRSLTPVGNGWYRVVIAGIAATTTTSNIFEVRFYNGITSSYVGDPTKGMFVWGGQIEAGAFATSYVPTTTTALTRAADVATVTGANFSSWFNEIEGAVYTEASTRLGASSSVVYAISNGTLGESISGNFLVTGGVPGVRILTFDNGVNQTNGIAQFNIASISDNTKDAFAYKQDDFGESVNGATTRTDTVGTLPTVNKLNIGSNWNASGFLNGHIRSFKYYPTRLSNAELQALTT